MDRTDPRIERTRQVVLDAVIDELADSGYDGMTVEAVADRAGVSKATLYRHWDGKRSLVCDALRRIAESVRRPEGATMREQLIAGIEQLADKYRDDEATKSMPALISASDRDPVIREAYHSFLDVGRGMFADIVRDGVEAGEFAPVPDAETVVSMLLGPLLVGRLLRSERFDPDRATELVDWLLVHDHSTSPPPRPAPHPGEPT